MQATGRIANQITQTGFDIHVNIFQRFGEGKIPVCDFLLDFRQAVTDSR